MDNKKNNTLQTIAWIVIIFCVIFLTALLASGILKVSINMPKNENKETTIKQNKEDTNDNTTDTNNNIDNEKYQTILEEYKNAMNDEGYNDNLNNEEKYPNINNNMMHYYHIYNAKLKYTFYDINKDGDKELIISRSTQDNDIAIAEIYTSDGTTARRFIKEDCLGERCTADIYNNGIIYFFGAGGASIHSLEFYKISTDGYNKETIASYAIETDENNNTTITKNNQKIDYMTDQEIINSTTKDTQKVDISKLNWQDFK